MSATYNQVRILGASPQGEVWSINPTFQGDFGPEVSEYSDLLSWATSIGSLNTGNVFDGTLRSMLSTAGSITGVRTEYYGPTGKLEQVAEFISPTPMAGTSSPTKPYQVAVVASILTGRPGRSYRGRLYLPAWACSNSTSTLRLIGPTPASIATSVAAFLKAIGTAAPAGFSIIPCVNSKVLGLTTPATGIAVGDIFDTQRRRRDSLQEQVSTATL